MALVFLSGSEISILLGSMCSLCCHMALVSAFMHLYSIFNLRAQREAGNFLCLPLSGISGISVWSHCSVSPLLFFCIVLLLFLSYPFCFWPILLTSFSLKLHFPKGSLFCVALVCLFSERLGEEYFSWWYVQQMLHYGTGIIKRMEKRVDKNNRKFKTLMHL